MKIPAILTCLLAVLLASVPVRQARADDVSFDVFYNNLADDGDWYNTPEYGYVWHPSVADKSDKWRPYTDGYWAQTDDGWTWVSYENFGWATYHYGRWTRLKDLGWAWVPGYDWGPGWVSWRTSDDYVGWAPLPPKADEGVYEGRVVDAAPRAEVVDYNDVEPQDYGPNVDVQYDIGPDNYCFVDTHNFGAPVLAEVCVPPERNIIIIERTVNVTNIYRSRGGDRFVVYNQGPDYNFISAHSERPIQQLRIERHDDMGFLRNGIHGGGNANQVRNGVFSVAAPAIARGPMNFAQVKPARVKQTLDRPEVVHGWSHAGNDPAAVQRLREQFKQQAQQAPPPRRDNVVQPAREAGNVPPNPARAREAGNFPPNPSGGNAQPFIQPNGGARQPLSDQEKATRRDAAARDMEARQKGASASQPAPAQPAPDQDRGPRANKGPALPTNGNPNVGGQPLTDEEKAARKARRQDQRVPPPSAGGQPFEERSQPATGNPAEAPTDEDKAARKAARKAEKASQAQPAPQPETEHAPARVERPSEPAAAPHAPQPQPEAANPEREARRAAREQEKVAPPEHAAPAQPQPKAPNPEREERRAEHPPQPAAPQPHAAQPEAPHHQPENAPQGNGDDKKKPNQ